VFASKEEKEPWNASWNASQYQRTVKVSGLAAALLQESQGLFKENDNVLDIGCGDGAATAALLQKNPGIMVTAVDFSQSMVDAITGKVVKALRADAGNLPIGDGDNQLKAGSFDKIWSLSCFHWVKNFSGLVAGMAKLLKPGGQIIAEFAYESPPEIKQAIATVLNNSHGKSLEVRHSDPWRRTHAKEWRQQLRINGFKDITIEPVLRSQPLQGEDGMKNWLKMFAVPFFTPVLNGTTAEKEQQLSAILPDVVKELKNPKYKLYHPEEKHRFYRNAAKGEVPNTVRSNAR
jgi:SAM-dependent methyltransferase